MNQTKVSEGERMNIFTFGTSLNKLIHPIGDSSMIGVRTYDLLFPKPIMASELQAK